MTNKRVVWVEQSPYPVVVGETRVIPVTTTPWGITPTSITSVKSYNQETGAETTSTLYPSGSGSISGDIVTLPALTGITEGVRHRVEVTVTDGTDTLVILCYVDGVR